MTKPGKIQLAFIGQVLHLALVSSNLHNRTRMLVVLFPHFIDKEHKFREPLNWYKTDSNSGMLDFKLCVSKHFIRLLPQTIIMGWRAKPACPLSAALLFLSTSFSLLADLFLLLHPLLPHFGTFSFSVLPAPISTSCSTKP